MPHSTEPVKKYESEPFYITDQHQCWWPPFFKIRVQ